MSRGPVAAVLAMLAAAVLIFHLCQRQLSAERLAFGAQPEVLAELEASLAEKRQLARLDPAQAERHRRSFDEVATLVQRLHVIQLSRDAIVRRYELALLAVFAAIFALAGGFAVVGRRRRERRLERLGEALAALAAGRTDVAVGDRRRDVIGRIATMVERTSRVMARDKQRLEALQNLSSWQEAARRHAHEMRTPLTGARLELHRLQRLLPADADEVRRAAESAEQEIERLGRFTQEFTSFARLPRPRREVIGLRRFVAEFVDTFAAAWPQLELGLDAADDPDDADPTAAVDRDLLRQVLVNLCDNSALAAAGDAGRIRFRVSRQAGDVRLDVADDGPGVADAVRERLFEPYTTTRGIGEGMGLGLAISKKVLLDHDGDLELLANSNRGATFRLTLPAAETVAARDGDTASERRETGPAVDSASTVFHPPSEVRV